MKRDESTVSRTFNLFCPSVCFLICSSTNWTVTQRGRSSWTICSALCRREVCVKKITHTDQKQLIKTFPNSAPNTLTSTASSSFISPRWCLHVFISKRCSFLSPYHAEAGLWLPHTHVCLETWECEHMSMSWSGLETVEACVPAKPAALAVENVLWHLLNPLQMNKINDLGEKFY